MGWLRPAGFPVWLSRGITITVLMLGLVTALPVVAQVLPYAGASFDLVAQMTVVSTILDPATRARVAGEMRRVLRPDGLILWYDLRRNSPGNLGVRAVGRAELDRLFPDCTIDTRSLTLVPPLARRLAPHAWWLAALLGALPPLQTHLLAGIRPARGRPPAAPAT